MQQRQKDGVQWLEFDLLSGLPDIVHRVFTRHGGGSSTTFSSLNLGKSVGDDEAAVNRNLGLVAESLAMPRVHLVAANQEHGTKHVVISGEHPSPSTPCDALLTQLPHKALLIKHADCQATILYDPVNHAVANVHCGWRGNVQNIYAATVQAMAKTFGTKPENLLACISPSLGPEAAEFINYRTELPESFWEFQIKPTYFDLWAISEHQLRETGILPHHIEVARVCTYANTQNFFSYRKEKPTGRNGTVVALSPRNHK